MNALLRSLGPKAVRLWINWASFKLGLFVGAVGGMLVMAAAMVGLTNSPKAASIVQDKLEALR